MDHFHRLVSCGLAGIPHTTDGQLAVQGLRGIYRRNWSDGGSEQLVTAKTQYTEVVAISAPELKDFTARSRESCPGDPVGEGGFGNSRETSKFTGLSISELPERAALGTKIKTNHCLWLKVPFFACFNLTNTRVCSSA